MIDTGEDDLEELMDEKAEKCVHQKFKEKNQWKNTLKTCGLTSVQLCRLILHFPFTIFEYFKIRFDRGIISLS